MLRQHHGLDKLSPCNPRYAHRLVEWLPGSRGVGALSRTVGMLAASLGPMASDAADEVDGSEEGWYRDPYGIHEQRWVSQGHATSLVSDRGVERQDEPPDRTPSRPFVPATSDECSFGRNMVGRPRFDHVRDGVRALDARSCAAKAAEETLEPMVRREDQVEPSAAKP